MDLTRPAPWTEFGADMEPLFAEHLFARPPRPGERPVEVLVTVPDGDGRATVMDIVTCADRVVDEFATAFSCAAGAGDYEITVRRPRY
jgi:hypothetical protein